MDRVSIRMCLDSLSHPIHPRTFVFLFPATSAHASHNSPIDRLESNRTGRVCLRAIPGRGSRSRGNGEPRGVEHIGD